jgi:hypothetical protein
MELDCLYLSPAQLLMIIVDSDREVGMFALMPYNGIENLDLNQMQILYQK